MDHYLKNLPEPETLLSLADEVTWRWFETNGHIHTPYSFSAFESIGQAFGMARAEHIDILGINDFYTTAGYREFHDLAVENKVFPLFNIEFIALDRNLQNSGIRVNDPNNPGRIYFSGKGLDFPESLGKEGVDTIARVMAESHRQVMQMVAQVNDILLSMKSGFTLDFNEIKDRYTHGLVRERHVAKAIRIAVCDQYPDYTDRLAFLRTLYGGPEPKADPASPASLEIEIRNHLLKAGGRAFVVEDEKAFLTLEAVSDLIIRSGGIPCYPVLLDDPKGNFTDFESDWELFYREMVAMGIFCIELIPGRNDASILAGFTRFFRDKGFIILFGTEHNTPEMAPMKITCRHGVALPDDLRQVAGDGACIIAAHQYYRAKGLESPVLRWAALGPDQREMILQTGRAAVHYFQTH